MTVFSVIAVILSLTALLAWMNHRWLRIPESIGVMAMALALSALLLIFGNVWPVAVKTLCHTVNDFDFSYFVLDVALAFLMFAGAFGIDTRLLARERVPVLLFATVGILLSTLLVGGAVFALLQLIGLPTPFLHCLLFGALISPTDPVAVLAILKKSGVEPELNMDVAGESLLNDGVAVVVFLTLYEFAAGMPGESAPSHAGFSGVLTLLSREVLGGVVTGLIIGWLGRRALHGEMPATLDILITLALVVGGYAFAGYLHVSAPLAMVTAGLAMSAGLSKNKSNNSEAIEHVEIFWEALDEIFNAVLFVLLGIVILAIADDFRWAFVAGGALAIPVVLAGRFVSVSLMLPLTKLRCGDSVPATAGLLTWGGLRGGISVALALSLKPELSRELFVYLTYFVVVFSIVVQGLTVGALARRFGFAKTAA